MERETYLKHDLYTFYLDLYFQEYFLPVLSIIRLEQMRRRMNGDDDAPDS